MFCNSENYTITLPISLILVLGSWHLCLQYSCREDRNVPNRWSRVTMYHQSDLESVL